MTSNFLSEVNGITVYFYMGVVGMILSGAGLVAFETPRFPSDGESWALVLIISLSLAVAVISLICASQNLDPPAVAITLQLAIVMLVILQKTIMKNIQPGCGNIAEIIGIVVLKKCLTQMV